MSSETAYLGTAYDRLYWRRAWLLGVQGVRMVTGVHILQKKEHLGSGVSLDGPYRWP